jgi:hypothetical protein
MMRPMIFFSERIDWQVCGRHIRFLFFHLICCVAFYLLAISGIAFFHFLLKHPIDIIEEWVFFNSWQMVLWIKLPSLYILLRILNVYSRKNSPLKAFFKQEFRVPSENALVIASFVLLYILIRGQPFLSPTFSPYHTFFSFIGTAVLYGQDLLLLCYLRFLFPLRNRTEAILVDIAGLAFFSINLVVTIPLFGFSSVLVLLMMTGLVLWMELYRSVLSSLVAGLAVPLILGPVTGLDPFWSANFSPVGLLVHPSWHDAFIVALVVAGWLLLAQRRRFLRH